MPCLPKSLNQKVREIICLAIRFSLILRNYHFCKREMKWKLILVLFGVKCEDSPRIVFIVKVELDSSL